MAETNFLARWPVWGGLFAVLLGGAGLYLGRGLATGSLSAPGPGAFPLTLSLSLSLFGALRLLRAAKEPARPEGASRHVQFWRSPIALAAIAVAPVAAALAFLGPLSPCYCLARFGPPFIAGASAA